MTEASGRIEAGSHRMAVRVYYEDTDAGGVVYYANYLKFAERARTEMLRLIGFDHATLAERYGTVFAVRDCAVEFRSPARLDDLLEVRSRLLRLTRVTLSAVQDFLRETEELARLEARVACLGRDGRPARIPEPVHRALQVYLQPQEQG